MQKHPRHSISGKVFIHNRNQIFIASLSNISRGGAFLARLVSLPQGEFVKLVIKSKEFPVPLQATGRVVRVEKNIRLGSAIQFDHLLESLK
jgi:hypothetical protein